MKLIHVLIGSLILFVSAGCANQSGGSDPVPGDMETAEQSSEVNISTDLIRLDSTQMALANISVGSPEQRPISDFVECTGYIELPPNNRHLVYATTKGFVGKVPQLIGDFVRKGTLLTTLRHPELIHKQRLFAEAASQLSTLRKDVERKETLAGADAASQRSLEEAEAIYDRQMATFRGLAAELSMVGIDTAQVLAGEFQTSTGVYAPVSGYIEQINVNPGKLVDDSQLLYEVLDVEHQHIELNVYAKDLRKLKRDQPMEVYVPGTDRPSTAYVYRIGRSIDLEDKTAVVHGHFHNEADALPPGTYVQARIYLDTTRVWSVPESAVIRSENTASVFIQEDGGFRQKEVSVGRSRNGYLEIRGLEDPANTNLVVKGAYYVQGTMDSGEGGHGH